MNKTNYDQVNVRISPELNDWFNQFTKKTKRMGRRKICKEELMEVLLTIFMQIEPDINWLEILTKKDLIEALSMRFSVELH